MKVDCGLGPLSVSTGDDESIAAIRRQIAFYASTPAYRAVLELHGWGELGVELTALSKQGRWNEMSGLVDDEVLDAFAIVAPRSDVAAELAARYGGLATRVFFPSVGSLPPQDAADLLAAVRAIPAA